ncbi:MAG: hypothetical protein RMK18_08545 [Armatimonadota bacterium]|nr:hypothetical protein [Armatimonadota bacterium]MCX7777645.1 hypothetical protein [Armatimonadota bacterium]MDW8025891.1 hypothetical protein [Armatimonadota bacterium]
MIKLFVPSAVNAAPMLKTCILSDVNKPSIILSQFEWRYRVQRVQL